MSHFCDGMRLSLPITGSFFYKIFRNCLCKALGNMLARFFFWIRFERSFFEITVYFIEILIAISAEIRTIDYPYHLLRLAG